MDDANMESNKLKGQIINLNGLLNKKNYEMDSIITRQKFGLEILNEIKPLFPQINRCLYSESFDFSEPLNSPKIIPIVILSAEPKIQDADKKKINNWLKQKTKNISVKVYYE